MFKAKDDAKRYAINKQNEEKIIGEYMHDENDDSVANSITQIFDNDIDSDCWESFFKADDFNPLFLEDNASVLSKLVIFINEESSRNSLDNDHKTTHNFNFSTFDDINALEWENTLKSLEDTINSCLAQQHYDNVSSYHSSLDAEAVQATTLTNITGFQERDLNIPAIEPPDSSIFCKDSLYKTVIADFQLNNDKIKTFKLFFSSY